MFKCAAWTVAAILYADFAFACSLVIGPIRAVDAAHYVVIGDIVEVIKDVPYTSGRIDDYAVGFRVRVKELIHPSRRTTRPLYFDVFPLSLTASCGLTSDGRELRARFPVGSEVRVIAKAATVITERPPTGAPLQLETSILNRGHFSRNDLQDDLRSSASRVYDYRRWTTPQTTAATDRALTESIYSLLPFELQKDLLRLKNATLESDKIAILERLAFYPRVRDVDLPAIARSTIKAQDTITRLEQLWTQRIRQLDESIPRPPPPRPDPVLRRPELAGLLAYLKGSRQDASDPARSVLAYLDGRAAGEDPLLALTAWFKAGFPPLRDSNGYWTTSADGVKSAFVSSVAFFLRHLPVELRTTRYLEVLDAVATDGHIAFMLAQGAASYLAIDDLKALSFDFMRGSDVLRRQHGAVMVCRQSETDELVWRRCRDAMLADDDYRVRLTVLHSLPPEQDLSAPRREERTMLKLQMFLADPDAEVRDAAARHVRSYAETAAILKFSEGPRLLTRILVELVQTRDTAVQETLAGFAAGMTTGSPYSAKTRIPREALTLLLDTVDRQRAARPGAEPLLVQLWFEWWQLVMREHSIGPGPR